MHAKLHAVQLRCRAAPTPARPPPGTLQVVAPERPLLKGQARPRVNVVCMEPSQQAFTELFHLRESFFNSNSTPWAQW